MNHIIFVQSIILHFLEHNFVIHFKSTINLINEISFQLIDFMWLKIGAASGAAAVALGAIGAHAILKKDDYMKDTWKTANFYHFIHSVTIIYTARNIRVGLPRNLANGLFTAGIILFSGSLYSIVLANERQPFAKIAPFGGICFIFGWLVMGFLP